MPVQSLDAAAAGKAKEVGETSVGDLAAKEGETKKAPDFVGTEASLQGRPCRAGFASSLTSAAPGAVSLVGEGLGFDAARSQTVLVVSHESMYVAAMPREDIEKQARIGGPDVITSKAFSWACA